MSQILVLFSSFYSLKSRWNCVHDQEMLREDAIGVSILLTATGFMYVFYFYISNTRYKCKLKFAPIIPHILLVKWQHGDN